MDFLIILLIAAAVFLLCYLLDKGFTKIFRGTVQHTSGLSVRVNKRFGSVGLIVAVLGLTAILAGLPNGWLLICGGVFLIVVGVGLVTYYMTFGIYYDEDQFVVTTFGKKSKTYFFKDIRTQQLFNSYGNIIIELTLSDGRTVQLQSAMSGIYPFMDHAFSVWLNQTGKCREDCLYYDPDNSCWFPPAEVK